MASLELNNKRKINKRKLRKCTRHSFTTVLHSACANKRMQTFWTFCARTHTIDITCILNQTHGTHYYKSVQVNNARAHTWVHKCKALSNLSMSILSCGYVIVNSKLNFCNRFCSANSIVHYAYWFRWRFYSFNLINDLFLS